jgi:hypothetical protein
MDGKEVELLVMPTERIRDLKVRFQKQTGICVNSQELYLLNDMRLQPDKLKDNETVKAIQGFVPTAELCVQCVILASRFSKVGSSGKLGNNGLTVDFGHISTAVFAGGPGSTIKVRLVAKGDGAQIGVCDTSYELGQGPWLEDAYSVSAGGRLYADGESCNLLSESTAGGNTCFDSGDIIEIYFAESGDSFELCVNGQEVFPVRDISTQLECVVCVGGSHGTRWEVLP